MSDMRILGIDPGTQCGWALREPDGSMISGVWDLSVKRHESAGMRLIRLNKWLRETTDIDQVHLIAYEEVRRHAGTSAAHVYGAITGQIEVFVASRNDTMPSSLHIEHVGIPVGTVKKFATGKGNANKTTMIDSANVRWTDMKPITDDNEADARWIAECAASQYGN